MITNPEAKVVLCYGDSNTWARKPDRTGRFAADERWTGLLQKQLGEDYNIVEEGLGGRTTDLDDSSSGRNGLRYLQPCLESHNPLDTVIIMLGTNDLKIRHHRSVNEITVALKRNIECIREYAEDQSGVVPRIILVSPILVNDIAPRFAEFYSDYYNHEAVIKSEQFANAIEKLAVENECGYLDATLVAHSGEDGLHMDKESHQNLANYIEKALKT